jgi:hypothetical protein
MKKLFIEASGFTAKVASFLDDWAYAALQNRLMENPELGKVIPGCGGLRKIRVGDPRRRKGKRGGARVIYLHVAQLDLIFLVHIYGKGENDDLDAREKKIFRDLAERFLGEAMGRATNE